MMRVGKCKVRVLANFFIGNLLLMSGPYAEEAHACTCAGTSTVEEALRKSGAVFSGEAIEIEEIAPDSIDGNTTASSSVTSYLGPVTFDVKDSWKGVSGETVIVRGQGDEASRGIDFDEGEN